MKQILKSFFKKAESHSTLSPHSSSLFPHPSSLAERKAARGFTLIEVNLAMLIMAGGILSIVGLYALGFRENRQSREDVAATAMADSFISPLVAALSATNVKWTAFKDIGNYPHTGSDCGWGEYFNKSTGVVEKDPQQMAETAFRDTMGDLSFVGSYDGERNVPNGYQTGTGMSPALVVLHEKDSAVVRIAFRAVKSELPGQLMAMPLFYTEVRFQGVSDQ